MILLILIRILVILSSSVVEQSAVNRLVVGSNPTWGVYFVGFLPRCSKTFGVIVGISTYLLVAA